MKGVIYARYSSDKQTEQSIEGQLRECKAYAERNGIEIIGNYIDRALSAKTDERPGFQSMIRDSAKRRFDVIIVWKLDRFSRSRYDSARYKAALKKNGVKVIPATETISKGAEGIILESVLEGMAEYYSVDLAEKVTRGMTENALKCKYNGSILPFGYTVDAEKHYQIDETAAPVVREIFERYAAGETRKAIITSLNARGLRTAKGSPFGQSGLHNMLKNRIYIGEYHFGSVVKPGGVPAIVTEEVFDRVQKRMAQNAHTPAVSKAPERYILTTKLFCGKCRTMMTGTSTNKKNGTIYRYYKCNAAKRHECDLEMVSKEKIENAVISRIVKLLNDRKTLSDLSARLVKLAKEENRELPMLERQMASIRKQIDNLVNAIANGISNRSTKERLDELEKEEDDLTAVIADMKARQRVLTKEMVLCFFESFRKLDLRIGKNRERLIDALVGRIFCFDSGKVTVFLNFGDDPIEFNIDDLDEANDAEASSFMELDGPP